MILTLRTGIFQVNLQEEVLRSTRTALIYCATTTTFAMLMISTGFSNDSATLIIIIKHAGHFNRHVKSCQDRTQHVYPKSVNTLRETLFDKLDGFGIKHEKDKKKWLYLISNQYAFHLMS